jgi:hypothetical protein
MNWGLRCLSTLLGPAVVDGLRNCLCRIDGSLSSSSVSRRKWSSISRVFYKACGGRLLWCRSSAPVPVHGMRWVIVRERECEEMPLKDMFYRTSYGWGH